ncbi:MAG: cob(I)yrinic acid a,c-diamide adenosyltransferase [Chloroflexi bacterium]|nr:MAG: cob(I)yrinic acid a,c-diamide adenosyltransferase [Chloroflexota bacterium]MBL1194734.1 cob(I)yrinic acid a,c-diamide adenosyltransferase [Chloroflexota bacterium]NOH12027.1 cob(I)yrinic acid a,c-diamide adenosyltransferase [Chloroflexota bacterium]
MPRLTKIYTRGGDQGETSLGTRQRVPKNHVRVDAYGVVDELNSMIGAAMAQGLSDRLMQSLPNIQNELFNLGSDLAFPEEDKKEFEVPRVEQRHVDSLEELIDELNEVVGPLENFILPGGSSGAAFLQVARTICRRAERAVVTLAQEEDPGELTQAYLNRLSDALFVMGRYENQQRGIDEPLWDSRA